MNTGLRKKAKKKENIFLIWWIMTLLKTLWKMWENRDIKLVTTERRNHLISEPDFHTTKFFKVYEDNVEDVEIRLDS